MKAWELEEGKIYNDQHGCLYRISVDGYLEYKNRYMNKWTISESAYNEFVEREFEAFEAFETYEETVDWSKVEVGTKVRYKEYIQNKWQYGFFVCFMFDKPFIMNFSQFKLIKEIMFSCDYIELFEWED